MSPTERVYRQLTRHEDVMVVNLFFKTHFPLFPLDLVDDYPWMEALSIPRRAVLVNIIFDVGVAGLRAHFNDMLEAMSREAWPEAEHHLRNSLVAWQHATRYRELADQLRTDEWTGGETT